MVGDHEAAGAIPVIPTNRCRPVHNATVPRNGTRFCEDRRQRFNSSRWHRLFCVAPSGTVPASNPGQAAFDSLAACFMRGGLETTLAF